MALWPTIEQFKRVINFDPEGEDPYDGTLVQLLDSAIARVKLDVGEWDEDVDEPDEALSMGALRMAQLMALNPAAAADIVARDPTYQRHLFGHRRSFGIS